MTRTFILFIILALFTLALLPNPENLRAADWENIQRFNTSKTSLFERAFALIGINIPKEWLPGIGMICLSLIIFLIKTFRPFE